MTTTPLKEITAFIFGRKYYANIVLTKGTSKTEICSFIFPSREDAYRHRDKLNNTMSYKYIETISFRSRKDYL